MNQPGKVRVYIGTEPKTTVACKVLECSIVRRTEAQVEFTPMIGKAWEYNHTGIPVGTGFSLRRWMVPAHCNWQGRAIYLDADQLVLSDIWDLWTKPEQYPAPQGTSAWMSWQPDKFYSLPMPQSSVMVIDCAAAQAQWGWHLERVLERLRVHHTKRDYAEFMHGVWMTPKPGQFETGWNHLNVYRPGKTRLLHYTKEPEQPWVKPDHPHARQWQLELSVAINLGYVTDVMLREALGNWGKKEDWRSTNGMHPEYAKFVPTKKKLTGKAS